MNITISKDITLENIIKAERVLKDNGIGNDEASIVLQAIGYTLLDAELYPTSKDIESTYLYTYDGKYKVNIKKSKLLADVGREKHIDRQGDSTQLWVSPPKRYFNGSCLDYSLPSSKIILLTDDEARAWVMRYYGGSELNRFGFDDAEDI